MSVLLLLMMMLILLLLMMVMMMLMLLTGTCNEASAIATEVGLKQGNPLLALPTPKNCNTSCRENSHRRKRRPGLLRQSRPRPLHGGGVVTPCRWCRHAGVQRVNFLNCCSVLI
jgi:hypothetical protein